MGYSNKGISILLLVLAEFAGMSLWFMSAAILPEIAKEGGLSAIQQALLSSAVQAGFVSGSLVIAVCGVADRFDPRRILSVCAITAAAANAALLVVSHAGLFAIGIRFATGALLAGVYPVGMVIAVGWGTRDRGLLVSLLIGALSLGSAMPHLAAFWAGADWRVAIVTTSLLSSTAAVIILFVDLGPYAGRASSFNVKALTIAWTNPQIRYTYIGYFGHMWELYAMWTWIGAAAFASYRYSLEAEAAAQFAKLTAFLAIALGAVACVAAGAWADRIGKVDVTIVAMLVSGVAAVGTALSFGGPAWLTFVAILIWGIAVIPDSAQFSALVADAAPAETAGSLLTLQTALGFALTIATVQAVPMAVAAFGWFVVLVMLSIGPAFGICAMLRLRVLQRSCSLSTDLRVQ